MILYWTRRSSSIGTLEHNGTSSDAASRPDKRGVRVHQTDAETSQYRRAALHSSEVSLRDIAQNESIYCESGKQPCEVSLSSSALSLNPHAAVPIASTIICLFRNWNLADSVIVRLTLPNKHLNLPRIGGELFLYVWLCCQSFSSAHKNKWLIISIGRI